MKASLLLTIARMGKHYTSYRSQVISYIMIVLCAVALLALILHVIRSHK